MQKMSSYVHDGHEKREILIYFAKYMSFKLVWKYFKPEIFYFFLRHVNKMKMKTKTKLKFTSSSFYRNTSLILTLTMSLPKTPEIPGLWISTKGTMYTPSELYSIFSQYNSAFSKNRYKPSKTYLYCIWKLILLQCVNIFVSLYE